MKMNFQAKLFHHSRPDPFTTLLFSVGPIGGISDNLRIGSWYQVGQLISYQRGSWAKNGFQISPSSEISLKNDCAVVLNFPNLFKKLTMVKVASGEIFVASDNYRSQLGGMTKADGVDMNLYGLVTVCDDHHLPLLCWRVVSDHADDRASEDFKKFVASYNGAGGKAVVELIRRLPMNPNSPAAYPNLNKALSKKTEH